MSRARLGLYVFCRRSLFEQCYELQPTFQLLLQRPDRLGLNLNEITSYTERNVADTGPIYHVSGSEEMARILEQLYQVLSQTYRLFQIALGKKCFLSEVSFPISTYGKIKYIQNLNK